MGHVLRLQKAANIARLKAMMAIAEVHFCKPNHGLVGHSERSLSRYYQPLFLFRLQSGFHMLFQARFLNPVPNHRLRPLLRYARHNLANTTTIGVRLIKAQPRKCRNQCDVLTNTHHSLHNLFGYWKTFRLIFV
jgi:hypothetical protein